MYHLGHSHKRLAHDGLFHDETLFGGRRWLTWRARRRGVHDGIEVDRG